MQSLFTKPTPITLYDSYLKREVVFSPETTVVPNTLKLYSCGPTVYNYQSIGNMRAVWLPDTITRVACIAGWSVEWCLNITDVGHLVGDGDVGEDKIESMARKSGNTIEYVVKHYTDDYVAQCRALNFHLPTGKYNPKATEYIKEQMVLALMLVERGLAYFLEDGIYFDYQAFASDTSLLTKLPQTILHSLEAESQSADFTERDLRNSSKDGRDFALWKFVGEDTLQKWRFVDVGEAVELMTTLPDSIFSQNDFERETIQDAWGCPGWHSECVAMICAVLADAFPPTHSESAIIDIHTGGEDHIDIHHKNEILQSVGLGINLATAWVHNKFVMVDGGKMSKSIGNIYLVQGNKADTGFDSLTSQRYDPLAYRLMLFEHQYTEQLNFTWDKLTQSQTRLFGLRKLVAVVSSFARTHTIVAGNPETSQIQVLLTYLTDNLNAPLFVERFAEFVRECVNEINTKGVLHPSNWGTIAYWENELLELGLLPTLEPELITLVDARFALKQDKNYEQADNLRKQIEAQGYEVDDYLWGSGVWQKNLDTSY